MLKLKRRRQALGLAVVVKTRLAAGLFAEVQKDARFAITTSERAAVRAAIARSGFGAAFTTRSQQSANQARLTIRADDGVRAAVAVLPERSAAVVGHALAAAVADLAGGAVGIGAAARGANAPVAAGKGAVLGVRPGRGRAFGVGRTRVAISLRNAAAIGGAGFCRRVAGDAAVVAVGRFAAGRGGVQVAVGRRWRRAIGVGLARLGAFANTQTFVASEAGRRTVGVTGARGSDVTGAAVVAIKALAAGGGLVRHGAVDFGHALPTGGTGATGGAARTADAVGSDGARLGIGIEALAGKAVALECFAVVARTAAAISGTVALVGGRLADPAGAHFTGGAIALASARPGVARRHTRSRVADKARLTRGAIAAARFTVAAIRTVFFGATHVVSSTLLEADAQAVVVDGVRAFGDVIAGGRFRAGGLWLATVLRLGTGGAAHHQAQRACGNADHDAGHRADEKRSDGRVS